MSLANECAAVAANKCNMLKIYEDTLDSIVAAANQGKFFITVCYDSGTNGYLAQLLHKEGFFCSQHDSYPDISVYSTPMDIYWNTLD